MTRPGGESRFKRRHYAYALCTEAEYAVVREQARRAGLSMSDYVRRCIMPLDVNPEAYRFWLGLSQSEVETMISGTVPAAVVEELKDLLVCLDETPVEKAAKRGKRQKQKAVA